MNALTELKHGLRRLGVAFQGLEPYPGAGRERAYPLPSGREVGCPSALEGGSIHGAHLGAACR
jgi:hypothetical protein